MHISSYLEEVEASFFEWFTANGHVSAALSDAGAHSSTLRLRLVSFALNGRMVVDVFLRCHDDFVMVMRDSR